ncbi:hypothetical protein [Streptomyces sp. 769]|uniref:hypothetical protein n=1 Tax=Streptomyces sp. 769 TaxID=1262452 RepID=UPI000689AE1E|nr:hypothetical protein [Streptomyces sp. 769]
MPQVRHWLRNSALPFAVAITLGLIAAHTSLVQPHGLQLDRSIQIDLRTGWLNTLMLGVSYVVSPVGGLLILGLWTLWLLVIRHRPYDAASTFLVVVVGWNAVQVACSASWRSPSPNSV